MSKVQSRPRASDRRPARRSMVELTELATRAIEEALQTTGPEPAEPEHRVQLTLATAQSGAKPAAEQTAMPAPAAAATPSKSPSNGTAFADADSAAAMMVKIAKDCQSAVLDNIKAGLEAALDHARHVAERPPIGGQDGGSRNDALMAFGAAAAAFRDTALDLMKGGVLASAAYAQDVTEARTTAEIIDRSGTHARISCELMLKQADAVKSLTQAITKGRGSRNS